MKQTTQLKLCLQLLLLLLPNWDKLHPPLALCACKPHRQPQTPTCTSCASTCSSCTFSCCPLLISAWRASGSNLP